MRSKSLAASGAESRPTVWVLADDRPGHRTQIVGLAESLGWDYQIKDLRFGPLNRIGNWLLGASLLGLDRTNSSELAPPWPDLVIAMGRRAAPVARWIGVQGGAGTRLVQLGRKGADAAEHFDLSVTCEHFRLPAHPRRLVTTLPITQVSAQRLNAAAERWSGLFDGPTPHIAVLVGGATAQHFLDAAVATKLARDALGFAADVGGTLHFVTSRRTGAAATTAIHEVVGASASIHEWSRDAEANPYLGYLALADVLIVTGESESMLAEAAAAAKTLYIYPIPEKPDGAKRRLGERALQRSQRGGVVGWCCQRLLDNGVLRAPRRLETMHEALYRTGAANRFGVPLAAASRSVVPDTVAIIDRVRAVLEADRAPRQRGHRFALAERLGFVARSGGRTFWLQGSERRDFANVETLIGALLERFPRLQPVLVTDRAETSAYLARLHPDSRLIETSPLPRWLAAGAARRMVRRLNPRLVLLLGGSAASQRTVIAAAADRQIPVLRVGSDAADDDPVAGVERQLDPQTPVEELVEQIAPLLQRDLKQLRAEQRANWHPARLATALLHSNSGRWIIRRRHRRFDDIEQLRAALGRPRTILCLGNGPSSEDPRLREVAYDCLFRVNDRWLGRGILDCPDVVFTGDRQTVARVRDAIFGFQNAGAADRILLQRVMEATGDPLRYVTVDSLGTFLDAMDLTATPTNGSTMLATAVALAPENLILSGIDLFMDPRGSYPGDATTANAYTPRHDREVEVRIIKRALEVYEGNLMIMSDVLSRTLGLDVPADAERTG